MKTKIMLKQNIFLSGCLILFLIFSNGAFAMIEEQGKGQEAQPLGPEVDYQDQDGKQDLQYVPGEVLVKFKEGADPSSILKELNVEAKSIERIHSIAPALAKFKKDYKLEKGSEGWYSFLGKQYKEVGQIPDEEMFKEAYKSMSPEKKAIYRNYKITLPQDASVEEIAAELKKNSNVEYAYPNYIREAYGTPNDPRYREQWALPRIKAPDAWDVTQGKPEVIIAVIDTGVDYNHEDLAQNIWINQGEIADNGIDDDGNGYVDDIRGYDFVSASASDVASGEDPGPRDSNPMDFHGHGTHVSGIATAVTNNNVGIAGVAPLCKIMAVRAGFKRPDGRGSLYDADIETAILYAVENGAKVINMSFGGSNSGAYDDEIKLAYSNGVILIAAAGNSNSQNKHYPAAMDEVIAVSATDLSDQKAAFSNYGDWIDVAAPGLSILSTIPNNDYASWNGTSMACPYVSGIAALITSINPQVNCRTVLSILQLTSDDKGQPGRDDYFGYGRVNTYKAVTASSSLKAEIAFPVNDSYIKDKVTITGSASMGADFKEYKLLYSPVDGSREAIEINVNSSEVINGLLGEWDTLVINDGKYFLILRVINKDDRYFESFIELNIDNVNNPPVIVAGNKAVQIGQIMEFRVAEDIDDPTGPWGQLAYSFSGLPPDASFDNARETICWRTSANNAGTYKITVTVTDNENTVMKDIYLSTVHVEEKAITDGNVGCVNPNIHGNKIVFTWKNYPGIRVYDIPTDTWTDIATGPDSGFWPFIYGNKVAWTESYYNLPNKPYVYDITLRQKVEITDSSNKWIGGLYENMVLLSSMDSPNVSYNYFVVYLPDTMPIRKTGYFSFKAYGSIYNDKIVWTDWRNGRVGGMSDIYMLYLTSSREFRITEKSDFNVSPAIYNDTIAWSKKENGYWQIYMYDIPSKTTTRITADPSNHWDPAIYENKIVWFDDRNGNRDIYMYDISNGMEAQITTNEKSQIIPHIYEDKVVWQDSRHEKSAIYMAEVIFAPIIKEVDYYVTINGVDPRGFLTITGYNFGFTQGSSVVKFENGAICLINSWSDNQIVAVVPQDAGSGFLTVNNLAGKSNKVYVELMVPTNHPPIMNPIGNKTVNEGESIRFNISAIDPDEDMPVLIFSADGLPTGSTFKPSAADWGRPSGYIFNWVPTYNQAGEYTVTFTVTDAGGLTDSEAIIITVVNINRPPILDPIGNKTVDEGALLEFTLTANDPDGDTVTYSTAALPLGASFDPTLHKFTWRPAHAQVGSHNVTFTISDGDLTDSETIAITVLAPSVKITNLTEGQTITGDTLIKAEVSHPDKMRYVSFYIDGRYFSADLQAPFEALLPTQYLTNGQHTIKVISYFLGPPWVRYESQVNVNIYNEGGPIIPRITIDNLREGQDVAGNITIQASVSDKYITYVYCSIDDKYLGYGYRSPYQFNWATTYFANGPHTVKVKGYHIITNQYYEAKVTVNVKNNTTPITPTVSIDNLVDGQTVKGDVVINATFSDPANMRYAWLYIDNKFVSFDWSAPFQFNWNTRYIPNGAHKVKVMTYHYLLNQWYWKEISVNVNNS